MTNEWSTFAFPPDAKTGNYMVHFDGSSAYKRMYRHKFSKHMISSILQNFDFSKWHASYSQKATFCMDSSDAIYQ